MGNLIGVGCRIYGYYSNDFPDIIILINANTYAHVDKCYR
jgi:hypothetical protein